MQHLHSFIRSPETKWQLIKHLLVGGSGVLVNYFLFLLLRQYYGMSTLVSSIIVHILLLCYIFPLQKYFTFESPLETSSQIKRFLINDGIYMSGDFLLATLFIDILDLLPMYGKAIGLALLAPISFMIQRFWVFGWSSEKEAN